MALAYPPEDVPQKAQAYPDQRTKLPDFVDKSALPDFKGPALTAEEIAQKNAARPWRERFAEKAWDLGETPISFEGLRDFGRSLLQKGNEPILSGPDSPLASGKYGLGDDMDILGAKLSPWMIPLMFASSMGKDLEKGDYTGAAKHGAESAGIFYLLRKLGEAAQKPLEVIKGVPGELGGITGFTYKPAAEGALSDFLPRNWRAFGGNAGVASLAHNAINRYFGVTGGLQAAGELWDDKGAPATELFDQYGTLGIGARKAAAIGAAALGLIPEAGMALGLGVDVGRNLLDPFARRLGSGQWGMEDPAAFGGAKEGMLPDSVLREEAASAFNKAEQALHERNDHAAYKNTIEGLTNALMQRGYSKENINNLYGEVRPGLRSMPGWMGTKGIDMTDVDPTQFAPGAFERYMLHRTQNPVAALENPLAVALAQKQSQQQAHDRDQELLHQAQQAQLGPTAPPPVLNLGGFRPSLPSGADPRFDPAGLLL